MADKPVAQLIRELSVEVARTYSLAEATATYSQRDIARIETINSKTADGLNNVEMRLAALDERVNEIKRITDETGRRRFTLVQGIICVFFGGILTFLLQVVVAYIQSRVGPGR